MDTTRNPGHEENPVKGKKSQKLASDPAGRASAHSAGASDIQFLDVYLGDILVGRLSRAGDVIQFLGEPEYLDNPMRPTLSLSMNSLDPAQGDTITRRVFTEPGTQWTRAVGRLPAFFENLLPEGALRTLLARERGVGTDQQFDLLAATGHSLPGAVSARPSREEQLGAQSASMQAHAAGLRARSGRPNSDPAAYLPHFASIDAPMETGFSLAGQQMKLAMSMDPDSRRYTLKARDARGVEIIAKLPSVERMDVVEIEFAGMRLAQAAGVQTPKFWMEDASRLDVSNAAALCPGGRFLAIERFDRPQGRPAVHMEDWAQLTGRRPAEKYAKEEAFVMGLRALRQYSPDRFADAQEFIRRQVANVLMGNTDAHLKNFSFIYPDGRLPRLSPAYDMVPIIAYLGDGRYALNEKVEAMFQQMTAEDFTRVAQAAGFAPKAVAKEVKRAVEQIQDAWPALLADLPIEESLREKIRVRLDFLPLARGVSPANAVRGAGKGPEPISPNAVAQPSTTKKPRKAAL